MDERFALNLPLWEIGLRASLVYLLLLLLMRFVPKRNAGHISPNDLLTAIVAGGLATDAIMGDSASPTDAILMIAIVLFWAWLLDAAEYRFPVLQRLMRHRQTPLIHKGRLIRRNMRRELVTEQELMAALRGQGIDDPSDVDSACLEADGEISVIPFDHR